MSESIETESRDLRHKLKSIETELRRGSFRGGRGGVNRQTRDRSRSPFRDADLKSKALASDREWDRQKASDTVTNIERKPVPAVQRQPTQSEPALSIEIEKPKLVETADPTLRRRNQRLFGVLQGHLQKAGTELHVSGAMKREDIDRRVAERLEDAKAEAERARELAIKQRKEKEESLKVQQQALKEQLAAKNAHKRRLALEGDVRAQFAARAQFIRTRGEIRIYWSPAKHNDATRQLLKRSQDEHTAELERILAAKMEQLQSAPVSAKRARRQDDSDSDSDMERVVVRTDSARVDDGVAAMAQVEQENVE